MSYLIVDEAIADLPMEEDPFEAAGQPIPSELPYNDDKVNSHFISNVKTFDANIGVNYPRRGVNY